ncbi:MAG: hypothetical protein QM820_03665 [Minicystis sp.]
MDAWTQEELRAEAFGPSRVECALAAGAHLSFFLGLWLIGPIVLGVVTGRRSRLIGFHAVQAALLQLFFLTVLALLALMLLGFLWISGGDAAAREELGSAYATFAVIAGGIGLSGMHLAGAFAAWRGVAWPIPPVGELAETLSARWARWQ